MRNTFFAMLAIAALSTIIFTSCEGDTFSTDVTPTITDPSVDKGEEISTRTITKHYFDNGDPDGEWEVDFGCKYPPAACFDNIIVTGTELAVTNDIIDSLGIWTGGQFQSFVSNNSTTLSGILGSNETSGLASGSYNLVLRKSTASNVNVFRTMNGITTVSVRPIEN